MPQEIIDIYTNHFGFMTSSVIAEINCLLLKGIDTEVIVQSLHKAIKAKKTSWYYARAILYNWINNGIKTMKDLKPKEAPKDYSIGDEPW